MARAKHLVNVNKLNKIIIETIVKSGDVVIDATLGNGNDAQYLASKVGNTGKVYGFDVQDIAIKNSREKLEKCGLIKNVELILDGHEHMDKYVKEGVSFIVFNLGYLPKGDHTIITKPDTTILAIKKGLGILKDNGVINIAVYTGHEGALEEKNALEEFVENLNQSEFDVLKMDFINQNNNPPYLLSIEKKMNK